MTQAILIVIATLMVVSLLDLAACFALLKFSKTVRKRLRYGIKLFLDLKDGKNGQDGKNGIDGEDGDYFKTENFLLTVSLKLEGIIDLAEALDKRVSDLTKTMKSDILYEIYDDASESGQLVLNEMTVLRRQIKKLQDGMAILKEELD